MRGFYKDLGEKAILLVSVLTAATAYLTYFVLTSEGRGGFLAGVAVGMLWVCAVVMWSNVRR